MHQVFYFAAESSIATYFGWKAGQAPQLQVLATLHVSASEFPVSARIFMYFKHVSIYHLHYLSDRFGHHLYVRFVLVFCVHDLHTCMCVYIDFCTYLRINICIVCPRAVCM